MGYRKIAPVILTLQQLTISCGLFVDTDINNGYGCGSRSGHKEYPGCCHKFDCPLGCEASLADLREQDPKAYANNRSDYEDQITAGVPEDEIVVGKTDLMIQLREVV